MKKLLAFTIMILFISVNIIPTTGNIQSLDDTTPPVTTHTLNPPEPDGENGYYVSDVEITLNSTDNESGVDRIEYRINGENWYTMEGNNGKFTFGIDGNDILIEYYAIDNAGNEEENNSFTLDMDQTRPFIDVIRGGGFFKRKGTWYARFPCLAEDKTSGLDRVEMYIDDQYYETINGSGPYYSFIIKWEESLRTKGFFFYCYDRAGNSYLLYNDSPPLYRLGKTVVGVIRNPEISEQNVTFFAVVVFGLKYFGYIMWNPWISISMLRDFLYLNNYDGYIGKHFIYATFYDWYPE
jgi:hypothetical protein